MICWEQQHTDSIHRKWQTWGKWKVWESDRKSSTERGAFQPAGPTGLHNKGWELHWILNKSVILTPASARFFAYRDERESEEGDVYGGTEDWEPESPAARAPLSHFFHFISWKIWAEDSTAPYPLSLSLSTQLLFFKYLLHFHTEFRVRNWGCFTSTLCCSVKVLQCFLFVFLSQTLSTSRTDVVNFTSSFFTSDSGTEQLSDPGLICFKETVL